MFNGFKDASGPAKFVTICVVGILLGLGLCGAGAGLSEKFAPIADKLFMVGAASFWLSGFGLILSLIAMFLVGGEDRRR